MLDTPYLDARVRLVRFDRFHRRDLGAVRALPPHFVVITLWRWREKGGFELCKRPRRCWGWIDVCEEF